MYMYVCMYVYKDENKNQPSIIFQSINHCGTWHMCLSDTFQASRVCYYRATTKYFLLLQHKQTIREVYTMI